MSIDSLRDGFVTLCLNTSLNVYSGACQMLVEGQYIVAEDAEAVFTQNSTNNLLATDTFEVGNSTFTIVATIGSTPGNVLKGANWAATMQNICNALAASILDTGATSTYIPLATVANVEGVVTGSVATFLSVNAATVASSLPSVYTPSGTSAGAFGAVTFAEAPDADDITPNVPVLVNSINDCDTMFGAGSILGESLKKVFTQCSQNIQVWALPRQDAAESVASAYTMVISGTATAPGVFSLFMLDSEYDIQFPVSIGDTPAVTAASLVAALPYNFPYTAVATGGTIVFTALNKGTCGNYLAPVYNFLGLQNYAPQGVTVAITQTTVGAVDPAPVDYATTLGSCCYAIYCLLGSNSTWQLALEQWIRAQWACNIPAGFDGATPQCFGHGYTYNCGTLGEVLACGDNAETLCRIAYPLNYPIAPYFLAAAFSALSACTACTSPELNIQGPVDGVLSAVAGPTSCQEPWSYNSRITLSNAGFVTWGPVTNAASQLTNPFIYQDITNNLTDALDRPNATWRSTSTRRWAANFSNLLAQFLDGTFNGLSAFSNGTQIKSGIFGTTLNMMRAKIIAWLNGQSGGLISAIQNVDTQVQLTSSLDTSPPCEGIPGNYALTLVVQPPVRINNIATTLFPQLFTNCNNGMYSQAFQLANQ